MSNCYKHSKSDYYKHSGYSEEGHKEEENDTCDRCGGKLTRDLMEEISKELEAKWPDAEVEFSTVYCPVCDVKE